MSDAKTTTTTMTTTATAAVPTFQLEPPEVLAPVPVEQSKTMVPLKPETVKAVDEQVARFVDGLMQDDVQSDAFKAKLDSAFRLGKEEISTASGLMQGRFMQKNFVGFENSPAYKAISDIRVMLDDLNPGKDGNLLEPKKILGLIPFGNKLQAYFRRFDSASNQLQKGMTQLYTARDDVQRDVAEIEVTRGKLWEAMQKLAAAERFSEQLDAAVSAKIASVKTTDPIRAKALEQEVLFYVRQNHQDVLTQQAVCVNGYLAMDVLKKTGREVINGCNRVATTGMSALAVAQTVARATGNQIKVMETLQGINATIGNLITESSKQLGSHVDATAQFASDPMIGIEKIKEMFDQTFKAMDAMDTFRAKAIDTMAKNNAIMKEQLAKAEQHVERARADHVRSTAATGIDGPVKL